MVAYRESLRLKPGDRDVHYQLGLTLRALGRTAAALDEFKNTRRLTGTVFMALPPGQIFLRRRF